ncbi:MAG: hypothetical protein Q8P99_01710 [bacterium]|nr:hypothetical protein [bacterium]
MDQRVWTSLPAPGQLPPHEQRKGRVISMVALIQPVANTGWAWIVPLGGLALLVFLIWLVSIPGRRE